MHALATVAPVVDNSAVSNEQRHITNLARNLDRLLAWRLKKAAFDYGHLRGRRAPCTVALVFEERGHG